MSLWSEKNGSVLLSSVYSFFLNAITCCPHLALNVNKVIHDQPSHFKILEGILKCMWKSVLI